MKLRIYVKSLLFLLVLAGLIACNSDEGGEAYIPPADTGTPPDIIEEDVCGISSANPCPEDVVEIADIAPDEGEDIYVEPDIPERTTPVDPGDHSNPKCSTQNLSLLSEIGEADDNAFYKVAVTAKPGALEACSAGCTTASDCPENICSEECCELCWRTVNLEEVGEEETTNIVPEVRTTLNNIENWKCAPGNCAETPTCAPMDVAARYVVWGQAVAAKGTSKATLWVDDYCLETTTESVVGVYEGKFTYDLLTVDANGRYEGKKGSQEIRVSLTANGDDLSANVEELGVRGQVFLKGTINAEASLNVDDGTMTIELTWCLSDGDECGDTQATLNATRNTFIGNLNAVDTETSEGKLISLTLSVDRIFARP